MKIRSLNLKKTNKAQVLGMPFQMIFSLIVIAFIIYVGFITIKGFMENTDRIKIASFASDFKYDINNLWQMTSASKVYTYDLPAKITNVCFASTSKSLSSESKNLSQIFADIKKIPNSASNNLFLYPASFPSNLGVPASFKIDCGETVKVACLDISELPNPYCIPVSKGTVKISLVKEGKIVKVVKSESQTSLAAPVPLTGEKQISGGAYSFSLNGESHTIEIKKKTSDYIELTISSEPQTVRVNNGETKEVDINNDGTSDLTLSYDGNKLSMSPVAPSAPAYEPTEKYSAKVYEWSTETSPDTKIVLLRNLDDSGYLRGKYVNIHYPCLAPPPLEQAAAPANAIVCKKVDIPGPPAYSAENIFLYEPIPYGSSNYFLPNYEGQHFDEVMLYYGYNLAAEYFDNNFGLRTKYPMGVEVYNPGVPCTAVVTAATHSGQHVLQYSLNVKCPDIKGDVFQSSFYRDTRLMFHEAVHAIFLDALKQEVNDRINIEREPSGFTISEGYAIYLSNAYFNNSKEGFGGVPINFDTEGVLYEPPKSATEGLNVGSIYAFAGSLWDIKKQIGADKTATLVTKSWGIMPVAGGKPDMAIDAMLALLEADRAYNFEDKDIIKQAFTRHGIECPAGCPY